MVKNTFSSAGQVTTQSQESYVCFFFFKEKKKGNRAVCFPQFQWGPWAQNVLKAENWKHCRYCQNTLPSGSEMARGRAGRVEREGTVIKALLIWTELRYKGDASTWRMKIVLYYHGLTIWQSLIENGWQLWHYSSVHKARWMSVTSSSRMGPYFTGVQLFPPNKYTPAFHDLSKFSISLQSNLLPVASKCQCQVPAWRICSSWEMPSQNAMQDLCSSSTEERARDRKMPMPRCVWTDPLSPDPLE